MMEGVGIVLVGLLSSCFLIREGAPQVTPAPGGSAAEAQIYASLERSGVSISYSDKPDWTNLGELLQAKGFMSVGTICITGAWILYRKPMYDASSTGDYDVASGDDDCFQPPGVILSMQPLGSLEAPLRESLTLFSEKFFASRAVAITSSRGPRFLDALIPSPKSLIIFGQSQWTIEVTQKKGEKTRYCLSTNFDPVESRPTCLVPDLSALALWNNTLDTFISFIGKGCSPNVKAKEVALLEDCKYFGEQLPDPNEEDVFRIRVLSNNVRANVSRKLEPAPVKAPAAAAAPRPPPPEAPEVEWERRELRYNETCPSPKVKELTKLLLIRLKHNFEDPMQLLWPELDGQLWKAVILDMSYDIAMAVLPEPLVPQHFLRIIREFMMYHLSKRWTTPEGNVTLPDKFMERVQEDLGECMELLVPVAPDLMDYNYATWMEPGSKSMYSQFARSSEQDIVIDISYLVGNVVLGVCHNLFGYSRNFFANYVHVYNRLYLKPLIEDWKVLRVEDDFILGGFDFELMYSRMGTFATNILQRIPNFPPFEKPLEVRNRTSLYPRDYRVQGGGNKKGTGSTGGKGESKGSTTTTTTSKPDAGGEDALAETNEEAAAAAPSPDEESTTPAPEK